VPPERVAAAGEAPPQTQLPQDPGVASVMAQIEIDRQAAAADTEIKRLKAQADIEIARWKAQQWAAIERYKVGVKRNATRGPEGKVDG
jgi:hypothetical protein